MNSHVVHTAWCNIFWTSMVTGHVPIPCYPWGCRGNLKSSLLRVKGLRVVWVSITVYYASLLVIIKISILIPQPFTKVPRPIGTLKRVSKAIVIFQADMKGNTRTVLDTTLSDGTCRKPLLVSIVSCGWLNQWHHGSSQLAETMEAIGLFYSSGRLGIGVDFLPR